MTKQQLIQKVKSELEKRRHQAKAISETNYHNALQNVAFHTNDTNIRTVTLKIARLEFENKSTDVETELLAVLQKERELLLKNLGYVPQDLEPKYTCKKCNDTGVCGDKFCTCYNKLVEYFSREDCCKNIDPTHTFKNSTATEKNTILAYNTMKKWCDKFPNKILNITLYGNTGTGKTYLTECIANSLISQGVVVHFTSAFNFNNLALKYHTCFEENKNMYLDTLLDSDVLVIDDLGTEPINKNVTLEYLYLVINERQLAGKPTIITTNLTPDGVINRYGERIFSRINNKLISLNIKLDGQDMRLKK